MLHGYLANRQVVHTYRGWYWILHEQLANREFVYTSRGWFELLNSKSTYTPAEVGFGYCMYI